MSNSIARLARFLIISYYILYIRLLQYLIIPYFSMTYGSYPQASKLE